MTCRILACGVTCFFLSTLYARAQGLPGVDLFPLTSVDSIYVLPIPFIIDGTVRLFLDDSIPLQEPTDYHYDPSRRQVVLSLSFRVGAFNDTIRTRTLRATYRYRAIPLRERYALRRIETMQDTARRRASGLPSQGVDASGASSLFGAGFQRSGSIIRGVTIGTNRDVSLQSGLRLQFSGRISDDVEVLAALTDEQSPLQPEGTTQTLREVDNVFFEVRSPWVGGILGKFIARSDSSEFTSFNRKLQGVTVTARPGAAGGTTRALYAVSPGRFRSESMTGREGDQGPYRLTGIASERDIVLVAGSERVFVDGELMTRGERDDYVIDYSAAEITFSPRRPMTSGARITVDFEYADQKYSRSFVALSHELPLLDSQITISASFLREGDDPDATIDITLSEADRELLASVGDNRSRAVRSGVSFVGRSDTLRGLYTRVDTLIEGRPDSIFVYDPSSPLALYNVSFAVPPDGIGDYRYVAFGQYDFAGKGQGSYLPVVYLPLPELRQVGGFMMTMRPWRGTTIRGEVALSRAVLNRLSTDPSASRSGLALVLDGSGRGDSVRLLGAMIGGVRMSGRLRYVSSEFLGIDRVGEVDFNNQWNASGRPGETGRSDMIAEGEIGWRPAPRFECIVSGGILRRQQDFQSLRGGASVRLDPGHDVPGGEYAVELIGADSSAGLRRDLWVRQRAGFRWPVGGIVPGLQAEWERRVDRASAADTLVPTSFGAVGFGPDLGIDLGPVRTFASFRYRVEDSVRGVDRGRAFVRDGDVRTFRIRGDLYGIPTLSSSIDLTWRVRRYDSVDAPPSTGRLDNSTLGIRSQSRWKGFDNGLDLDALYEAQSERAARLQRLFIRVPFGQGEYLWVDGNGDGLQSTEEFRLTNGGDGEYVAVTLPTEELFPVVDLRATLRLRMSPRRFIDRESALGRLLSPVSMETFLRLDEKSQSQDDRSIYLLDLTRFQNDSTTITGASTIQQDLLMFESNPEFSIRFRFLDHRVFTRLVASSERTRSVERTMRLRWRPTFDIGLQFDAGFNGGSLHSSDTMSRRQFDITTTMGSGDLGYRPADDLEIGWLLTVVSNDDAILFPVRSTTRATNSIRGVYSIQGRGRLRLDLERTNVAGRNVSADIFSLPYQLTDGYAIGTTWVGRVTFDYRFGTNIQASITYTGRVQPADRRLFNIGSAEVRAFF